MELLQNKQTNEDIIKASKLERTIRSYMPKEEFIEMLQKIDFQCVKNCNMELITCFYFDEKDDNLRTNYISFDLY